MSLSSSPEGKGGHCRHNSKKVDNTSTRTTTTHAPYDPAQFAQRLSKEARAAYWGMRYRDTEDLSPDAEERLRQVMKKGFNGIWITSSDTKEIIPHKNFKSTSARTC